MNSQRIRFACALMMMGLPALLGGCLGEKDDSPAADSTTADTTTAVAAAAADGTPQKPKKEKAIKVNVSAVTQGNLVLPIFADGAIRTPRSLEVKTKVGGELTRVLVRDGDKVRKGQVLARIDPREYEIALEESRYRHLQALSQMAAEADTFSDNHQALADFTRQRDDLERVFDRGGLSREEYQNRLLQIEMESLNKGAFREAVFQQRTGLAEARMAEERARLNLEYTEIRAPFAGIVQGLKVVDGEILSLGSSVCTIYNNDELEAVIDVLEADLGNLVVGRPVLMTVPATGETLEATIDVISPTLDEATRTCEVIIRFDNTDGRYRPGMFVRARIAGWVHPDKLMVPKAALLTRENGPLVFKKVDDRAFWLYVETGLQNEDWVEIKRVLQSRKKEMLAPGDEVVVSDHLTLADGSKIKTRKTVPSVDRWGFADLGGEVAGQ